MASTEIFFWKKSSCAPTVDLQRLDQSIFLAKILCQFTKTSVQNLKWPLMASTEKFFCLKNSSCTRTVDLQRLNQGIFLAKILCRFTKTSVQNLKWPLMASTEKNFV